MSIETTLNQFRRPTRMEIVWNTVKKNPGKDAYELASLIPDMPYGSVSSSLSDMDNRGMVYVCGKKGRSRTYSTALETFQILNRKITELPKVPLQLELPNQTGQEPSETKPKFNLEDLENLTVREARELYGRMKELFA